LVDSTGRDATLRYTTRLIARVRERLNGEDFRLLIDVSERLGFVCLAVCRGCPCGRCAGRSSRSTASRMTRGAKWRSASSS
jgi:hypothetical protein